MKVGSAADGTEGGGADRRAVSGGRLDEAALSLGAEPVAVAADRQYVAVVQEPVEDGGACHGEQRVAAWARPQMNRDKLAELNLPYMKRL